MKRFSLLLVGLIGLSLNSAQAGDAPRGSLLELHSCEVFAGGCVVASEAVQGGRYMLRAWHFTGGTFEGQDFAGLCMAALQLSPDNLAAPESRSGRAVVYVPQNAKPEQTKALVGWLKSSQPDFHPAELSTRAVPLRFEKAGKGFAFSAGDSIAVDAAPLARCESFTCGEALWYQPRSATSLFSVAVDHASRVNEPMLQLKWADDGKRNVFLARFGEPNMPGNAFVTLDQVCGTTGNLF